jgi:hypothetical protein
VGRIHKTIGRPVRDATAFHATGIRHDDFVPIVAQTESRTTSIGKDIIDGNTPICGSDVTLSEHPVLAWTNQEIGRNRKRLRSGTQIPKVPVYQIDRGGCAAIVQLEPFSRSFARNTWIVHDFVDDNE